MNGRVAKLELKNFLAGRGVIAALVGILLAGLIAIEHGHRTITRQEAVIADGERLQAEHLAKMLSLHGGPVDQGPGNLLYYLNFFTSREPSRFAPLAVGLRDVVPYNLKVRMLALEGQLYDSEIGSPETQALGNFDLTFLLVFLYPLLLIAFLHNVLSSEQEAGTWDLVRSIPVSRNRLLFEKAALRFLPVFMVWVLTVGIAVLRLGLPVGDERMLAFVAISVVYLLFWFALALAVIGFGRSTNSNALTLLSAWLCLSILLPAAMNLGLSAALPATSSFEVALRQREGYHNKWDRPRAETLAAFYTRYPEHAAYRAPLERFSWGWYYAMQQMGDEEAAKASTEWRQTLHLRDEWARGLALLSPPAMVQLAMSRMASTGLSAHLAYLESVRAFHTRLRGHFYPLLFRDPPVPAVNWSDVPRHRFSDDTQPVTWAYELWRLVVVSLLTGCAGGFGLRRGR